MFVYKLSGSGFESSCSYLNFRFRACFEQGIPWKSSNYTECGFTLKFICDKTRTYSEIYRTDKYSEHSSITWSVLPNGWVFVYKLSGSGFKSSWIDLNFNFCACFQQEVPWHSSNYRVWNNLKCVHDMKRTYSEMDRADNYSEHSSIIWSFWPNGSVFVYELSGSRFNSSCSRLNFLFGACFLDIQVTKD